MIELFCCKIVIRIPFANKNKTLFSGLYNSMIIGLVCRDLKLKICLYNAMKKCRGFIVRMKETLVKHFIRKNSYNKNYAPTDKSVRDACN